MMIRKCNLNTDQEICDVFCFCFKVTELVRLTMPCKSRERDRTNGLNCICSISTKRVYPKYKHSAAGYFTLEGRVLGETRQVKYLHFF